MDDLSARLAEILNDPKAMNEIRSMAEGLFTEKPQEKSEKPQNELASLLPSGLDMNQMANLIKIMNTVKSRQDNTRAQLLLALKPHLSEPRREKVDTAVKLLQLIEALPLLKESGLLNLL
ncbi:MAG: hypothetical protein II372_02275 [Clostridia bacterium]|jgi:hypothetical protein|nr:hypothetical protein [Clostridia bacterium]